MAFLTYPGTVPKYLRPIDYWRLPEAFDMYKKSCPKLFWDPLCSTIQTHWSAGAGGAVLPQQSKARLTTQRFMPPKQKGNRSSRPKQRPLASPELSTPSCLLLQVRRRSILRQLLRTAAAKPRAFLP